MQRLGRHWRLAPLAETTAAGSGQTCCDSIAWRSLATRTAAVFPPAAPPQVALDAAACYQQQLAALPGLSAQGAAQLAGELLAKDRAGGHWRHTHRCPLCWQMHCSLLTASAIVGSCPQHPCHHKQGVPWACPSLPIPLRSRFGVLLQCAQHAGRGGAALPGSLAGRCRGTSRWHARCGRGGSRGRRRGRAKRGGGGGPPARRAAGRRRAGLSCVECLL